jgi:hypothetical protein
MSICSNGLACGHDLVGDALPSAAGSRPGSLRSTGTISRSCAIGPRRWSWLVRREDRDVAEGEAGIAVGG